MPTEANRKPIRLAIRACVLAILLVFSSVSFNWWNAHLQPYSLSVAGLILSLAGAVLLSRWPRWQTGIARLRESVVDMGAGARGAVAAWCVAVPAAISWWILDPAPHIPDEFSYLFQAELFASGNLWAKAPSLPEFFPLEWTLIHEGRLFSVFPPGWPLLLSLGVALGHPWLVAPVLAGLCSWVIWLLSRELFDRRTANAALILCALSPFFLFLSGSFMSHTASLLAASTFVLAFLRGARQDRLGDFRWGLLAAFAIFFQILIRPPSGCFLWAPVLLFFALFKRSKASWTMTAFSMAGVTLGVGAYLLYNRMLIGEWFIPPLYLTEPANRFGFGPGIGLDWYTSFPSPGHDLWRAVLNLNLNMSLMNNDLFGWPLASIAFVIIALLFGRLDWRHRFCGAIVAASIVGYAAYWYNGGVFGARFYHYLLPYLAILTVEGLRVFQRGLTGGVGRIRSANSYGLVSTLIVTFTLYSLFIYIPKISHLPYWNLRNISHDLYIDLQRTVEPGELVFIQAERSERYAPAFMLNEIEIDRSPVIFAWDNGVGENQRLIERHPNRRVRYWRYDLDSLGDRRDTPLLCDPIALLGHLKRTVLDD